MNQELLDWLDKNKICFQVVDDDVIEIDGFGKMYYEDTSNLKSIFRKDVEGNVKFNTMESIEVLQNDGIDYIVFKFGDNWYYYDTRLPFKMNILKYIGKKRETKRRERFVNLGVHTPYELLNGSFSISEWVKKAKWMGCKAIGVCDYNTMASTFALQKQCKAEGIGWIFGYSFTFNDGSDNVDAKIYCQTQEGLQNLLRIQKTINVDRDDHIIGKEELFKYASGNVLVFGKHSSDWIARKGRDIGEYFEHFVDCFYQLDPSEYKADRIDVKVLESIKKYFDCVYYDGIVPPVLISDCYYLDKEDAKNKIILNKIETGAAHEQSDDQYFKDIDEHWERLAPLFDDTKHDVEDIFSYACENTLLIADGAKAEFETGRLFMPEYMLTDEEKKKYFDKHNMFLKLLEEGFNRLVPKGKEEIYRKRLEHEIYVLESTNNVDYMLVQYDTTNWARKNGILVGCGRGSAAGCLVLYLLGITLIDPIKYNLLFERFLLPERAGLYQADTTIIAKDIDSREYVEVVLENNKICKIDKDAQLLVKRDGNETPIVVYGDELEEGDDIVFDNRDLIFTLKEI